MHISYKWGTNIPKKDLIKLYEDAGWTAYVKDVDKLFKAMEGSLKVCTAWKENELAGLIRVIGDGETIIYVQDVLVMKKYKRNKIGSTLMNKVMDEYKNVRQKVLLTDDSEETRGFYEKLGFSSCDKGSLVAFVNIG